MKVVKTGGFVCFVRTIHMSAKENRKGRSKRMTERERGQMTRGS